MDSGYESDQILSWQEERGIGYVVKISIRGEIWSEVFGIAKAKYRKIQTERWRYAGLSLRGNRGQKKETWW